MYVLIYSYEVDISIELLLCTVSPKSLNKVHFLCSPGVMMERTDSERARCGLTDLG